MSAAVRFGAFEFHLQARELRRHGMRVRAPDQSLDILAMLLARPGDVVTRDEIRQKLWSDGTVVEFEHSISSAVRRLREALGDSSAAPRYIETVPRQGYRFIAPIEALPSRAATSAGGQEKRHRPDGVLYLGCAAVLLVLTAAGALVWRTRSAGAGGDLAIEAITREGGRTTDVAISPDGKVMVFASDREGGGDLNLWTRRVEGGPPVRLTSEPFHEHEPAFSPDGAHVAFRSEKDGGGIYVVPALGGVPRRLVARGRTPKYSPDGRWVAYWIGIGTGKDASQAYVVSADGRIVNRVFAELPAAAAPVWSPTGTYLAVARTAGPKGEVFCARFDSQSGTTGPPQPMGFARLDGIMLLTTCLFTSIQWLPDDRAVVYSRLDAGTANIYRAAVAGTPPHVSGAPERMTTGSAKEMPLEPVGTAVPFTSVSFSMELWELPLDANTGNVRGNASRLAGGWINDVPSLTADGSRLVYVSNRSGQGQPGPGSRYAIAVRDMRSGAEVWLTSGFGAPVISRDGRRVVYAGQGAIHNVSLASLDSIPPPEVVCQGCARPYAFSPEGSRLLYRGAAGIDMLEFSTGRKTHVVDVASTLYSGASLSPDGAWIAFNEVKPGASRIWAAPFRTAAVPRAEWRAVTGTETWDDQPRWSPDGKLLYYLSDRDGFRCIWAQPLSGDKRAEGSPFAVYHFHKARSCPMNVEPVYAGLEVAHDRIVWVAGELTGDLWLLRLPGRR